MTDQHHLLCIGFGYVASRVAGLLMDDEDNEWRFSGTSRNQEKINALSVQGINMVEFDDPQLDYLVSSASHILVSTAPNSDGCPTFERIGDKIKPDTHIIYLSATSVYGDQKGKWVDENSMATRISQRGKSRLLAEKSWASKNATLLRLGAIYGPGRNVLPSLIAGEARRYTKTKQVFCRIHVVDIAHIIGEVFNQEITSEVFNVVDDNPSSQSDLLVFAAELLKRDPPPEEPLKKAPESVQAFYAENRRVKNDKVKDTLGLTLQYPSYEDGLPSLLD